MLKNHGVFITVEGADGSGKSTAVPLIRAYLEDKGYSVLCTREPGGSRLAEQIREILIHEDRKVEAIHPVSQLLLFYASRIQHLHQTILPALTKGQIVLCDRYIDSTAIFQGKLNRLEETIEQINRLPTFELLNIRPDITFYFDVSLENSRLRSQARGQNGLDQIHLQHALNPNELYHAHFTRLLRLYKEQIRWIDGNQSLEAVQQQLTQQLTQLYSVLEEDRSRPVSGFSFLRQVLHRPVLEHRSDSNLL